MVLCFTMSVVDPECRNMIQPSLILRLRLMQPCSAKSGAKGEWYFVLSGNARLVAITKLVAASDPTQVADS
jgi:hypothetical protein